MAGSSDLWIVLEYCSAGNLSQLVDDGPIGEARAKEILVQMLRAVFILHTRLDIIHRDIKCANVFLTKDGMVKLGDLNVSKIILSLYYMIDYNPLYTF